MKKIFLKLNDKQTRYWMFEKAQTMNFSLQNLYFYLTDAHDNNLNLSKNQERIILWDSDCTKQMADIKFSTKEELDLYYLAYRQYCKRRWDDMPKLEISLKNYEDILQKWNEILERQLQYIIISQDDSGYVDLVGKDELSEQDIVDMKVEHERCLKYQVAWDKYDQANPDRSEVWRSQRDDEYEADWQKYLDEPLD